MKRGKKKASIFRASLGEAFKPTEKFENRKAYFDKRRKDNPKPVRAPVESDGVQGEPVVAIPLPVSS